MHEVMNSVIKDAGEKNILFYVHGRGQHPEKGIDYLPQFEKSYNLKIVMFHWDSWINTITRPERNAVAAGADLNNCLQNLEQYKKEKPEAFKNRKIFYMSHSMGNIVFKSFMENYYSRNFPDDLFAGLILNAPDVESRHHNKWVDKINFSRNIYINFNGDDFTLLGSKAIDYKDFRFFRGYRLGATPRSYISKNATYLDLSSISLGGHEYFLEASDHPISQIFRDIFQERGKFNIPYKLNKKYSNIFIF
ncbi:MAG: hypothetical protein ACJAT2_002959 [Bacteriovoracaceae bacterium]|jgi:hypothetical protein